jgi:hypothetical protein
MTAGAPRRRTGRLAPLPLKALYTVPELMAVTGLSRCRLMTLVNAAGIEPMTSGRTVYIPLSEIRRALEPLWTEIVLAQRVMDGAVE